MEATPGSLTTSGVRFVRIVWCDNGNVLRAKAVNAARVESVLEHGVGISEAQQAVPATVDAPAPGAGLGPVGEVRLVPDLSTLVRLPWAPGHARVMGDLVRDGAPWPLCPRTFLRRIVADAAGAGLSFRAAFENEFYLLAGDGPDPVPADSTPFAAVAAMNVHHAFVDSLAAALEAQGLAVEQYYPESGPGQQELSIGHDEPLRAADAQVAYRETVHAVSRAHGLRATFLPKPFPGRAGSGSHLHLSLWRDGRNETGAGSGLSPLAGSFAAGVLAHLPALVAVTAPTTNSYRRIVPSSWSGAYRCWGLDNREAAVRVPTHPDGVTNLELKTVDATSNPYLALGAVLAAGLDGVARSLPLPAPATCDPALLGSHERLRLGIDRLPETAAAALAALEDDATLLSALGPGLARAFLAVRRAELEATGALDHEAEVRALLGVY